MSPGRFERPACALGVRRSVRLSYGDMNWTRRSDSNGCGLSPAGLQPAAFDHLATSRSDLARAGRVELPTAGFGDQNSAS